MCVCSITRHISELVKDILGAESKKQHCCLLLKGGLGP